MTNMVSQKGGSLSKAKLTALRQSLTEEKNKMQKKKKVKGEDMQRVIEMEGCLKQWETECERRERKQVQKTMTALKVTEPGSDSPKGATAPQMSLYPSLGTGWQSAVDDTLDHPPPYRPPQPTRDRVAQQAQHADHAQTPPPVAGSSAPTPSQDTTPSRPLVTASPDTSWRSEGGAVGGEVSSPSPSNPFTAFTDDVVIRPPLSAHNDPNSPVALRLRNRGHRHQDHGHSPPPSTAFAMPMVQVAGPEGQPMLIYRPWSADDIIRAAGHLPKPDRGGEVMAKEVSGFIRDYAPTTSEMARVMATILTPPQFASVRPMFTDHRAPATVNWATAEGNGADPRDVAYRAWVRDFITALREKFPTRCDLAKVTACRLREGEGCEEYHCRLLSVFDDHSVMTRPDPYPGPDMTPYESLMKSHFLAGLPKVMLDGIKDSCVGLDDPSTRLVDEVKHAKHQETRLKGKTEAERKRRADAKYKANQALGALQLVQHARSPPTPQPQGSPQDQYQNDACFYCGQQGHWVRDCPQKAHHRRGRGRGRGGS